MIRTPAQLEEEVIRLGTETMRIAQAISIHEFDDARMRCFDLAKRLDAVNRRANWLADQEDKP